MTANNPMIQVTNDLGITFNVRISYSDGEVLKDKDKIPNLITEVKDKIIKKEYLDDEYLSTLTHKKIKLELRLAKYTHIDDTLVQSYEENIEDNIKKIQSYKDEVARSETILNQIRSDKKKFNQLKEKEAKLLKELTDYQFWIEGFPQIRTWMIESFLPSFEEQVNTYLNNMEVGMRVRFQTFKEKKTRLSISFCCRYGTN